MRGLKGSGLNGTTLSALACQFLPRALSLSKGSSRLRQAQPERICGVHYVDLTIMNQPYPFLRFNTGARAFLARSIEHLAAFERDETVEHFFYAALNLRFGIEARLNEYLAPALKSIGKDQKSIFEYVASKLLKRLLLIDPDAGRASTLRITREQSGHSTVMQFTPVSQRLAARHGQLGELLHFKFFTNNEHWLMRKPLGGDPHRSMADYLPLLKEGAAELQRATSGLLLSNPRFTEIVEEVAKEARDDSSTPSGVQLGAPGGCSRSALLSDDVGHQGVCSDE